MWRKRVPGNRQGRNRPTADSTNALKEKEKNICEHLPAVRQSAGDFDCERRTAGHRTVSVYGQVAPCRTCIGYGVFFRDDWSFAHSSFLSGLTFFLCQPFSWKTFFNFWATAGEK